MLTKLPLIGPLIESALKTESTYRVVVPSCKPDDNTGGTVQKRVCGVFINFESLHNPENRVGNSIVKTWETLEKQVADYCALQEKRRSAVADVGFATDGHETKGSPYKDAGMHFELRRFKVPKPSEDVLERAITSVNRFGRGGPLRRGFGTKNITGTSTSAADVLASLHKEGRHETVASENVTGHTKLDDETFEVKGVDTEKIVRDNNPSNNQQKGKNNQGHQQHGGRPGYREPDDR